MVEEPPEGWGFAFVAFIGLLLGAATVLGLFCVELFAPAPEEEPSSTSSTTIIAGPQQPFPDVEELRLAIEALAPSAQIPPERIPDVVRLAVTGPGGRDSAVLPPR